MSSEKVKVDVYEMITQRMIERIEKEGKLPWRQPWANYADHHGGPQNLVSKKFYRGVNVWILSAAGYGSPFWLSFKQAQQLGGSVRRGEKGTPIVYWNWFMKNKGTPDEEKIPFLKYSTVFNADQCENITVPKLEEKPVNDVGAIESAEKILKEMPKQPKITFGEARAYYSPSQDRVNMPKKESFNSLPEFYSVFFHELIHSTGHESRCARMKSLGDWHFFGSDPYAKEELVAEMGAAFLSGYAGIQAQVEDNNVAYIQGWIEKLKDDKKFLVQAAAQAQKASDFILGVKFENEENDKQKENE